MASLGNQEEQMRQWSKCRRELKFRYYSWFFFLTYLILPSVATTIFGMFPCKNVDPYGEDNLDDYFLIADYSISCHSDRYKFGVAWASIMIFVYPVGIPMFYFYALYVKRGQLVQRFAKEESEGTKILGFLYQSYKPEYWYFEIVEVSWEMEF